MFESYKNRLDQLQNSLSFVDAEKKTTFASMLINFFFEKFGPNRPYLEPF